MINQPAPRASSRPLGASGVGSWPATPCTDALRARYTAERARRDDALAAIRAHLEEQPSPNCVRTAARRWVADILALAETVAERTEHNPRD